MRGWRCVAGCGLAVAAAGAMATIAPRTAPPDTAVTSAPGAEKPIDPAAPVPIEVFAALPPVEQPKLSPDGSRFAAKMAIGGKQYFVISSVLKGDRPITLPIGDKLDINWWRWVGDGWLAVGVGAMHTLYGDDYYITRTFGISADGKQSRQIGWADAGLRADDLIWSARDGSPRILLGKQTGIQNESDFYPSVFEYDLSTGRGRRVVVGMANVYNWYADPAGAVRMGWQYDDDARRGALLYRPGASGSFARIAVQRRGEDAGIVVPLLFRKDGSAVAIDDADGRDAVYEMSLPDLKLGKRLFGLSGYDVDGSIGNAANDDVDGFTLTERWPRIEWLNPALRNAQAEIDKAVGDRRARIVSWNADRSKFLVEVGRPSQAGALYYYGTGYGTMLRFSWNNPALKARSLSPVSTIR